MPATTPLSLEDYKKTLQKGTGNWAEYYAAPEGYIHQSDIASLNKIYEGYKSAFAASAAGTANPASTYVASLPAGAGTPAPAPAAVSPTPAAAPVAPLTGPAAAVPSPASVSSGSSVSAAGNLNITRDLAPGMMGEDIRQLQEFLKAKGFFPSDQASTGYYGDITTKAVKDWQNSIKLDYGQYPGYFGPKSRAALSTASITSAGGYNFDQFNDAGLQNLIANYQGSSSAEMRDMANQAATELDRRKKAAEAASAAAASSDNPFLLGAPADLEGYINNGQDQDIQQGNEASTPPVNDTVKFYKDLITAMMTGPSGEAVTKPAVPSTTEEFKKYREEYGVSALEDRLNLLKADEAQALADLNTARNTERAKPVAMNVISGRIGELERQSQERLDVITRQKNSVIDELKTKYDLVTNLMSLGKQDYTAAADAYDTKFSQSIQMINLVKGIQEAQKTDEERKIDNARANITILYNQISAGGMDPETLTPEQKLLWARLETQAGIPSGTYEALLRKNPKGELIGSNTWQGADGTQYASFITRDKSGQLKTETVNLGKGKTPAGEKPTSEDTKLFYKNQMATELEKAADDNGYISPEDWKKAKQAWVKQTPYSDKDFDDNFRSFIDPTRLADYSGFEGL